MPEINEQKMVPIRFSGQNLGIVGPVKYKHNYWEPAPKWAPDLDIVVGPLHDQIIQTIRAQHNIPPNHIITLAPNQNYNNFVNFESRIPQIIHHNINNGFHNGFNNEFNNGFNNGFHNGFHNGLVIPPPAIPAQINLNTIPLSGTIKPSSTSNSISYEDFATGDEVIVIDNNPNFVFRKDGLQAWFNQMYQQGTPYINPLTNLPITLAQLSRMTVQLNNTTGGKKSKKTKKYTKRRKLIRRKLTRKH